VLLATTVYADADFVIVNLLESIDNKLDYDDCWEYNSITRRKRRTTI
jgi:hypothetical protein